MKIPRPKRGKPSEEQVAAIIDLLKVWPEATGETIEKFVHDKFKVVMTNACLQEAKRLLKLHEPEHTENTALKKAFAQMYVARLVQVHGVSGLSDKAMLSEVTKACQTHFGQRTSGVLMKSWVSDCLTSFASTPLYQYAELCNKFTRDYTQLDTIDKKSRQESLL